MTNTKQWRRQLGPLFAPGAVERMKATVRQRAIDIIDRIADKGSCDFMADFAQRFPTTIVRRGPLGPAPLP